MDIQRQFYLIIIAVMGFLQATGLASSAAQKQNIQSRQGTEQSVEWRGNSITSGTVIVQLLAMNNIINQRTSNPQRTQQFASNGPLLATTMKKVLSNLPGTTFFLHGGDAQPPTSPFQDHSNLILFNMLGNDHCRPGKQYDRECNLIGLPGNNDFAQGAAEMIGLIMGTNTPGPNQFQGAAFPFICANLVETASGQPLFQPYAVRMVDGVPIGFIGALLQSTSQSLLSDTIKQHFEIRKESDTINKYVKILQGQGVHTIVVMIHQGDNEHLGSSAEEKGGVSKKITPILKDLDDDVDVVLCGQSQTYNNTLFKTESDREMLVVQAWPLEKGFTRIQLEISRASAEVVAMRSSIRTLRADGRYDLHSEVAKLDNISKSIGGPVSHESGSGLVDSSAEKAM